jgi:hypothetical protein
MAMVGRRLIAGVALALMTAVTASAQAGQVDRCSIGGQYQAKSVLPYSTYEDAGYTSYRQFRGADVFVAAQPGLTQEWLQRVLTEQIASGTCDFGVHDVSVSVLSAGSGFSVRLSGRDERAAGEILRNAERLVK